MTLSETTLDLIERLRGSGRSFCVATIVRAKDATSAKPGAKAVVTDAGELHGFLGGHCVIGAVRAEARLALAARRPKLIRIKPEAEVDAPVDADGTTLHKSSCPSGGTVEIFLEPMQAARQMIILGSSPIAHALARMSEAAGYRTIIGARDEETGTAVAADEHAGDFAAAAGRAGPEDAVVLSTQGRHDGEALEAALKSEAGYIGMVASRRKFAALADDLSKKPDLCGRIGDVRAPAGLDISAVEPDEIALSIMAEIVALRRGRQFGQAARESRARRRTSAGNADHASSGRRPKGMDPDSRTEPARVRIRPTRTSTS